MFIFLRNNKKKQITDTTIMNNAITGLYVLPYWKIICSDENIIGKRTNFIKTTKSNSPTTDSGASSLYPIGSVFYVYRNVN